MKLIEFHMLVRKWLLNSVPRWESSCLLKCCIQTVPFLHMCRDDELDILFSSNPKFCGVLFRKMVLLRSFGKTHYLIGIQ